MSPLSDVSVYRSPGDGVSGDAWIRGPLLGAAIAAMVVGAHHGWFWVALYWLATRRGMRASVTAHAVTDVILFTAVLPSVLFTGWFAA